MLTWRARDPLLDPQNVAVLEKLKTRQGFGVSDDMGQGRRLREQDGFRSGLTKEQAGDVPGPSDSPLLTKNA